MDRAKGRVGFYFSDNRDLFGNAAVMSYAVSLLLDDFSFSVGARGYLALLSDPDDDVFGLAPGVTARYALPVAYPMQAVNSVS